MPRHSMQKPLSLTQHEYFTFNLKILMSVLQYTGNNSYNDTQAEIPVKPSKTRLERADGFRRRPKTGRKNNLGTSMPKGNKRT